MLKKQVSPKLVALVFGIIVICFAIAFYVVAWEEPGSAPPEGNVPAPLNTSSEAQAKIGGLLLNTGGFPNGLIVDQGNVGIGTVTPSQKLDVVGNIVASGTICDSGGANCIGGGGGGGGGGDAFADSVSKDINTTYTADTSGILIVRARIGAAYLHNYVEIRSDDNATPTTVVGHIGAYCTDNCNTNVYHTMSVPILKDKKYRVVQSGVEVTVYTIEFYPNN